MSWVEQKRLERQHNPGSVLAWLTELELSGVKEEDGNTQMVRRRFLRQRPTRNYAACVLPMRNLHNNRGFVPDMPIMYAHVQY